MPYAYCSYTAVKLKQIYKLNTDKPIKPMKSKLATLIQCDR